MIRSQKPWTCQRPSTAGRPTIGFKFSKSGCSRTTNRICPIQQTGRMEAAAVRYNPAPAARLACTAIEPFQMSSGRRLSRNISFRAPGLGSPHSRLQPSRKARSTNDRLTAASRAATPVRAAGTSENCSRVWLPCVLYISGRSFDGCPGSRPRSPAVQFILIHGLPATSRLGLRHGAPVSDSDDLGTPCRSRGAG